MKIFINFVDDNRDIKKLLVQLSFSFEPPFPHNFVIIEVIKSSKIKFY